MLKMLAGAGLAPEHLHAVKKTGRIVTRENTQYLIPQDIAEWNAAVEEYEAQSKQSRHASPVLALILVHRRTAAPRDERAWLVAALAALTAARP